MAVKKLSSNIQSIFSSSIHLLSYKRAIEELVYNSLDVQSTSIAIRIHIQENKIQVVDNGCGIAKEDFELLGQKYATSKFVDLSRYKATPNSYGFRGQALASLVEVSKLVKITSRTADSEETWMKIFYKGRRKDTTLITTRPSKGTTVEVNGFLYNLNIQNKSINPLNEINEIKVLLEQLSLIHNNVSFSLRDDSRNEIVFKAHKYSDIYKIFKSLFEIERSDIQEIQVEKLEYKVIAYIAKNNDHPDRHHWIFLNRKFINNTKLLKIINDRFLKTLNPSRRGVMVKSKNKKNLENEPSKSNIPFYFIFITCPYYDYDISNTPKQSILEFKNWNQITMLVDKLVKFYIGKLDVTEVKIIKEHKRFVGNEKEKDGTRQRVREIMNKILGSNFKKVSVSQMQNGKKGKLIKRKKKKAPKLSLTKVIPPKEIIKTKNNNLGLSIIKDCSSVDDCNMPKGESAKTSSKTTKVSKSRNNNRDITIPKRNKINKQQLKQLNTIHKKTIVKKKHKKDPLIEIFKNKPETVAERCNLLAQEVENFIPHKNNRKQKVFVNETVNYSNFTRDNKTISVRKRVGEIIIHDYIPLKSGKNHYNGAEDSRKNRLKTSYDLLKPVIDTIETNTQKSLPSARCSVVKNLNAVQHKIIGPQLTYQSHHYVSNQHTVSHHHGENDNILQSRKPLFMNNQNERRNLLTSQRCDHFDEIITDISLPIHSNERNMKYNVHNKPNKDLNHKKKLTTKQFNIPSFSDKFTSHTIEFSDSKYDKEEFKRTDFYNINASNTYEIPDTNVQPQVNLNVVTSTFGFTYTITTSSVSMTNSGRYSLTNNKSCENNYQLTDTRNVELFASKTSHPGTNKPNVIFVSNSNDKIEIDKNIEIEPLNVCETILNSTIELEREFPVNNNQNQFNDSLFNHSVRDFASEVRNVETSWDTQNVLQSSVVDPNSKDNAITSLDNYQEVIDTVDEIEDSIEGVDIDQIVEATNQVERMCKVEQLNKTDNNVIEFDIKNRPRFVPKGMSPILKNRGIKSNNYAILESRYFTDDLYEKFRDEVQTHTEVYEAHVKNPKEVASKDIAKVNNRLDKDNSSLTFDGQSLKNAKVLGQIDTKFIASIIKGKTDQSEFLVLFDQHAVHERIRLEDNLADYFSNNEWKITKIDDVLLRLSTDDIMYLHNYKDKFATFGLEWTIVNNSSIKLNGVPAAILGKNTREVDKVINAVKNLITEEINMIRSQKGCVSLYPKSIMDLVFSEACRYAIMFGDALSHSKCVQLIKELSACKTPFQCAHGRPVMAVITDIKPETRNYQINMEKIYQLQAYFKNKTK